MNETLPTIMIATDLQPQLDEKSNTRYALKTGLDWAQRFSFEALVCHVHASSLSRETLKAAHLIDQTSESYVEQSIIGKMQAQVQEYTSSSKGHLKFQVLHGKPHEEIANLADKIKPELLILGTKARTGIGQMFMGNVTEKIIHSCHSPVLAVRDQFAGTPQRITFLCDFSNISAKAWHWTKRIALEFKSSVSLVHVITPATSFLTEDQKKGYGKTAEDKNEMMTAAEKIISLEMDKLTTGLTSSKITSHLIKTQGSSGEAIAQFVEKERPHLLIMGSHGHGGIKKLILGSNADYLISHSDCNILIVRP